LVHQSAPAPPVKPTFLLSLGSVLAICVPWSITSPTLSTVLTTSSPALLKLFISIFLFKGLIISCGFLVKSFILYPNSTAVLAFSPPTYPAPCANLSLLYFTVGSTTALAANFLP